MTFHASTVRIRTQGFTDIHDLTPAVNKSIAESGCSEGVATVFVPGSTAGITTIEYESGVLEDLKAAFERIAPQSIPYRHDERWGDGNGFAHVRASLLGPSLSVPFSGGEPACGTWQQIILIDFDNRPRSREVMIRIIGK
jgi:secondary thiamine-phosphate synthase enzyme